MDVLLLIFDVITAIALWRGLLWSIWLLFSGIFLLQILPYTLLRSAYAAAKRSHFIIKAEDTQIINSLLGTEILILSIFMVLVLLKK